MKNTKKLTTMKNLITLSLIVFISTVTFAGNDSDTTKKTNHNVYLTKSNSKYVVTKEIINFIESGDDSSLLTMVQDTDITFIALSDSLYVPSEDKDYFKTFINAYLTIRDKELTVMFLDKEFYDNYYSPAGGMFKITIFYSVVDRYDDIIINYNNEGKIMGITINDNLQEHSYVDMDLNKVIGGEYGPNGMNFIDIKKVD